MNGMGGYFILFRERQILPKISRKKVAFYIEILPVESNAHWNVTVTKLNSGVDGYTLFGGRINLFSLIQMM